MLRQVEQMRLADAVHLSSGHSIMWPLHLGDALVAKVNVITFFQNQLGTVDISVLFLCFSSCLAIMIVVHHGIDQSGDGGGDDDQ